jgi:hypothetical protein
MSINALANAAAARRTDVGAPTTPTGVAEIAAAAATPPDQAPAQKPQASGFNTALNVLFGYIPTEIVTLYVAVVAAIQPPTAAAGAAGAASSAAAIETQWIAFWCFAVITPVAVWVVYANKLKAAGKPLPLTWSTLPVWEMVAALIAFLAWAFALPNSPFRSFEAWYSPALASLAVLFTSTVLGLLAPLFQQELRVDGAGGTAGGGDAPPPQTPPQP